MAERKKRASLTSAQQVERNRLICEDKLRGMSWEKLCEKHELSLAQCKRVFLDFRKNARPVLQDADPFDIVWESVGRYEQMIEDLALIALDESTQDSVRVGAINTQARLVAQKDELLQKSGILPQNLGKLKIEHDVRYIAGAIIKVFEEDKVPISTRRRVLELLRQNSAEN